jgi:hypothetical protein
LPNVLWEVANESSGGGSADAAFAEMLGLPARPIGKSFLRGHHPILMDFGSIGGVNPPDPSVVDHVLRSHVAALVATMADRMRPAG